MSYYPILKAPGTKGWTTLCNFPPNNWEIADQSDQFVNVTWPVQDGWMTRSLEVLAPNAMRTITAARVVDIVPEDALALLSLTVKPPPVISESLPKLDILRTTVPAWRATLGLSTEAAQTSYQGEVDPFPPQATLLTFGPFLQFGPGTENFLILLNVENSPIQRSATLEIYNTDGRDLRNKFEVHSNDVNIIPLDGLGFQPGDLPMFICREMAGIPLYFSRTLDGTYLSLEHTHPPGSLVVHGKRWEVQKVLKSHWFGEAK